MIGRKVKLADSDGTWIILDKILKANDTKNPITGYLLENDMDSQIRSCAYYDIERIMPREAKKAEGYIPPCDTGLSDALHPTIENFKRGL